MDEKLTRDVNRGYQLLGLYQVGGGLVGYVQLLLVIATLDMMSIVSLLLLIFVVFLFGYSTFCGAMLLRKRKAGIQHSLINQYLQLVGFGIGGYLYHYSAGVFFGIGIHRDNRLAFPFGPSFWQMRFNSDEKYHFVYFNLVALILILLLYQLKRKVDKQETQKKIAQLGS